MCKMCIDCPLIKYEFGNLICIKRHIPISCIKIEECIYKI